MSETQIFHNNTRFKKGILPFNTSTLSICVPLTDTRGKGSCARAELHAAYKSCLSEIGAYKSCQSEIALPMSLKMFSVAVLSSLVVAVVLGQDDGIRCGECIMEMHRFGFVDSLELTTLYAKDLMR